MASSTTAPVRDLLPANVKPVHYRVTMEPDLVKFTFTGTVEIDVEVKEASSEIVLNTLELDLHSVGLTSGASTESVAPISTKHNADNQTTAFGFAHELTPGSKATLKVAFSGELNDKLAGFYRSVHTDDDGVQHVVATTQMEAADCRRAFPCFDEPALKATFDVTLVADKKFTALSNMDVKSTTDLDNGKVATHFNTSPIMSTYLVAFIVGEMTYVESNLFRVPVRVYMTPGMEKKCHFSAELGAKTLEFFEKKFQVPYPLPKMDMVGIHDFSAGAMENWGLVTYRVVDLLFDEENDNAHTKQRVAEVVQHELAHQWFGNLVTMDWWDGLWLNEGFATWMSWYSCNEFYPEWKVWETYVGSTLQACLGLDSLRSSHPVEVPVKDALEVNQIFDAISYSKGSCIVKMVANYLGEETFIKGISLYLNRHKFGNTETKDLWRALSEVSGKDVLAAMDTWTSKVGFPFLTVTEEGSSIHVKQSRFLATGDLKPEEDETLFPVSLLVRTKGGVDDTTLLEKREDTVELKDTEGVDFYKLNADQSGIYRVLYPPERIVKLSKAGTEGLLSVEDKVGLIADVASLSQSGYQKTSSLLDILELWKTETEPNVWSEMTARLGGLRLAWNFEPAEVNKALEKFYASLVVPKAKELGWTFSGKESLLEQQLKGSLFASAVSVGDKEIVAEALSYFHKYAAGDEKSVHPNIRGAVFAAAAKYGTEKDWESLVKVYTGSASSDANTALASLGCSTDPKLLEKSLALALDGTVRTQDVVILLRGFIRSKQSVEAVWAWLQANFAEVKEKMAAGGTLLQVVVGSGAGGLVTREHLAQLDKFFGSIDTRGFDKMVAIARDRLLTRQAWVERDAKDVSEWLNKHVTSNL